MADQQRCPYALLDHLPTLPYLSYLTLPYLGREQARNGTDGELCGKTRRGRPLGL